MFLFYLLGVGLPCRWIFCQFWLCEEAQCVYLRRHLGSQITYFLIWAPPVYFLPANLSKVVEPPFFKSEILCLYTNNINMKLKFWFLFLIHQPS